MGSEFIGIAAIVVTTYAAVYILLLEHDRAVLFLGCAPLKTTQKWDWGSVQADG